MGRRRWRPGALWRFAACSLPGGTKFVRSRLRRSSGGAAPGLRHACWMRRPRACSGVELHAGAVLTVTRVPHVLLDRPRLLVRLGGAVVRYASVSRRRETHSRNGRRRSSRHVHQAGAASCGGSWISRIGARSRMAGRPVSVGGAYLSTRITPSSAIRAASMCRSASSGFAAALARLADRGALIVRRPRGVHLRSHPHVNGESPTKRGAAVRGGPPLRALSRTEGGRQNGSCSVVRQYNTPSRCVVTPPFGSNVRVSTGSYASMQEVLGTPLVRVSCIAVSSN